MFILLNFIQHHIYATFATVNNYYEYNNCKSKMVYSVKILCFVIISCLFPMLSKILLLLTSIKTLYLVYCDSIYCVKHSNYILIHVDNYYNCLKKYMTNALKIKN